MIEVENIKKVLEKELLKTSDYYQEQKETICNVRTFQCLQGMIYIH